MALNVVAFAWLGAAAPWASIWGPEVAPFTHFLLAGFGILLLRRLPVVLFLSYFVPQLSNGKETCLAGFFGPMGVSAMYYLFLAMEYVDHMPHSDRRHKRLSDFRDALRLVVWFSVIISVVVHGTCIGVYQAIMSLVSTSSRFACLKDVHSENAKSLEEGEREPLLRP
jgi:sodium/hydrogen antiporter